MAVYAPASGETHLTLSSRVRRSARVLRTEPGMVIAVVFLVVVVLVSLFPSAFAPFDPLEASPLDKFLPPSWPHVLGTDAIGRDVFSRLIYGAGTSMPAALLATGIGLVLGSALGVLAATFGGAADTLIMRLLDAVLAVPGLLIVFAFLAALGNGVIPIAVAVGIGTSVSFGRLMRAETYRIRSLTFVEAARAGGARSWAIAFRHVIPTALRPVVALAALDVGAALLAIGAVGYLGFGAQPPWPEWGAMIADGQRYLSTAWWLSIVPGLTFIVIVLAANQISRYVERARD